MRSCSGAQRLRYTYYSRWWQFFAPSLDSLRTAIQTGWRLMWIFGPLATLIYGMGGPAFYLVETVLLLALSITASTRRTRASAAVFIACGLVLWIASGVLAMVVLV
ncbi:MAG: hypothetical protein DMD80_12745 [Candidatus Rokuibacteriota bacterium]|nr:MAG: hypothetical protein DMD80_12745 [Candidatus Rokubacteria bacterium]PYN19780.1 MAG: hypothetical protein DMD76_25350 [Candidatus Rokubacteria bacterium]